MINNTSQPPKVFIGYSWDSPKHKDDFIYDQVTNTKFIPIIFSPQQNSYIPTELRRFTYYLLNTENLDSDKGYENLYRHLTKQPLNKKPQLGFAL